MPVCLGWDDDQRTVLRYDLVASWSWEDFHRVTAEIRKEVRELDYRVDVLVDMTQSRSLPSNAMTNLRQIATSRVASGIIVIVGADGLTLNMYNIFRRVYEALHRQLSVHFANTLEDGRAIIVRERVRNG